LAGYEFGVETFLDLGGFTDVDARDARAYIGYLDAVATLRGPGKTASYAFQGITAGMSVLDLGCGTGEDVRTLAELVGPTGRVVGVDSSREMIAEAIRRGIPANAAFSDASVYALPFPEATFDACRAERVLQHLERPDDALRDMRRVLRPAGSLLAIDHDWETLTVMGGDERLTERIVSLLAGSFANGAVGRNHATLLQQAGFRDVRVLAGVTTLPFGLAYTLVLRSATGYATARGAIAAEEAVAWTASLLAANRVGAFAYSVDAFTAIGWR
jgi:SAM-dependent methyltransferase